MMISWEFLGIILAGLSITSLGVLHRISKLLSILFAIWLIGALYPIYASALGIPEPTLYEAIADLVNSIVFALSD